MEFQPRVSVVVGVQHAWQNVARIAAMTAPPGAGDSDVLFCHAADDPPPAGFVLPEGCAILAGPAGALIPELWALGIARARGAAVAILSANCIPDPHWLRTAAALDLATHVAYGGAIRLAESASAPDTALHILRYSSVTPPQPRREIHEVAADNAVYRRAHIIKHDDLLQLGFWEPSFHARFRADGLRMAFEPDLAVTHVNTYTTRAFLARRFEHGRAFGQERMSRFGPFRRVAMLVLAPLAACFFAAKVIGRGLASPGLRWKLPASLPWLAAFVSAWSLGEFCGYLGGVFGAERPHRQERTTPASESVVKDGVDPAMDSRDP